MKLISNLEANQNTSEPLNIQSKGESDGDVNTVAQPVMMFEEDQFNKDGEGPEIHQSPSFVENEDKPKSSASKPNEVKSEGEVLNNGFDRSQEEVSKNHIQISDKLEIERRKELENAGRKLKLKMFKQQRWFICTLQFPWKHFQSVDEAYCKTIQNKAEGDSKLSKQLTEIMHTSKEDHSKSIIKSKSARHIARPEEEPKKKQSQFLKKGDGVLPGLANLQYPELAAVMLSKSNGNVHLLYI